MRRIILGVQVAFGAEGGAFGARTAVVCGVDTSVAIPAGVWLVETDAHTTVRFTYDFPTGTFVTWVPASTVAMIYSDGFNVEFRGDGTGGTGHQSQVFPLA